MEVFPSRGLSRTCQWLWWPAVRLSPVLAPWHPYWQPSPTAAYPRSTHGVIIAMEIATALLSPQHTSSAVSPEPACATCWVMSSSPSDNNKGLKGNPWVKGHCQNYLVFSPDGEEGWWGARNFFPMWSVFLTGMHNNFTKTITTNSIHESGLLIC